MRRPAASQCGPAPTVPAAAAAALRAAAAPSRPASAASSGSLASGAPRLESTVIAFRGPVLFTAPHGKEVWREGDWGWVAGISGLRLHRRELYTTELVLRLCGAPALKDQAGFVVWNLRPLRDAREGLDPNYLHAKDWARSPWHRALHAFRSHCSKAGHTMALHWDIHGKLDRNGSTVEVGLEALRFHRPGCYARLRATIAAHLGSWVSQLPPDKKGQRFALVFPGMEERDNGFWQRRFGPPAMMEKPPEAPATMAAQGAALGLLSIQIELPRTLRTWAANSTRLQQTFAEALAQIQRDLARNIPAALLAIRAPPAPAASAPAADALAELHGGALQPSRPRGQPRSVFGFSALCWCAATDSEDEAADGCPCGGGAEAGAVARLTGYAATDAAAQLLRDCAQLSSRDTEKPI